MRFQPVNPPRRFRTGAKQKIEIKDCGEVVLEADEQLTFLSASGKKYDFTAKEWGFYATPSINDRLIREGFRTALVRNTEGKLYVMCVDASRMGAFEDYIKDESQEIVEWLHERCFKKT